ncbi:MAG: hypothetical protein Q4D65_01530 [Peptostreptococcaceae bacterium]|nr:hypothetical protein [Peptostreptococcaceae bacterium]
MEKVSGFILPIGIALVVLVYTSLGVLSYSTAKADNGFANRNIEYNTKFYEAEGEFADAISEIDNISHKGDKEYKSKISGYANKMENLEVLSEGEDYVELLFVEPISENVLFKGHFFAYENKEPEVIAKGLANVEEWEQKYLALWKGTEDEN